MKIKKKCVWGGGGVRVGSQGGCERRSKILVNIQKKSGGMGRVGGSGLGSQGGCERRSEVFVKILKKKIIYIDLFIYFFIFFIFFFFFFFLGGGGVGTGGSG